MSHSWYFQHNLFENVKSSKFFAKAPVFEYILSRMFCRSHKFFEQVGKNIILIRFSYIPLSLITMTYAIMGKFYVLER